MTSTKVEQYALIGRETWLTAMQALALPQNPRLRDEAYNRLMAAGRPEWAAEVDQPMRRARFVREQTRAPAPPEPGPLVETITMSGRTIEIRESTATSNVVHAYEVSEGAAARKVASALSLGDDRWRGSRMGGLRRELFLPDKGVADVIRSLLTH